MSYRGSDEAGDQWRREPDFISAFLKLLIVSSLSVCFGYKRISSHKKSATIRVISFQEILA